MIKKYLILLIGLCFFASPVWAFPAIFGNMGQRSGGCSDHCSGGCPGADSDIFCEDASDDAGDGKLCTWTDTVGDGTINWKKAHTNTWCCADKGSYALQVITNVVNPTYVKHNAGAEKAEMFYQFYVDFVSEGLADTERDGFFYAFDNASNQPLLLQLYQDGANLKVRVAYGVAAQFDTLVLSTTVISVGTVYRFRIHVSYDDLDVSIAECDGSNNENIVDSANPLDWGVRYVYFGHGNQDAACTYEFDCMKADDDTAITVGCTQ